eukprot:TRINITY_DN184_c0_g1_i1.p1 TRINITY_DN184_c0_g1~~TRINITY_DN184_c0_g1_i1.p1  ORF type:complete len:112 (+),score=25.66 TRINITY_DN184_c0_g1_i1:57-392(+)
MAEKIKKVVQKEGSGPCPAKGQKIKVHCTGYVVATNKKFWSTHDTNTPFEFQIGLGKVIRGWDEGFATMKLGEIASLTLAWDYAYGENGFPAWGIPPRADLRFDVEVLSIN